MENEKITIIFCANEQGETKHTLTIDGNGEWVFTCIECGRAIKFAASLKAEEIKDLLIVQKTANEGQITQESLDKKIEEFSKLDDFVVDVTEPTV